MNWRVGMFRAWVAISILWIMSTAVLFFVVYNHQSPFKLTYIYSDDSTSFTELPHGDIALTEDAHRRGLVVKAFMHDGSSIIFSEKLGEQRMSEAAKTFWNERWWRYCSIIRPWFLGAVMPPMALLALGAMFAWIARGFRSTESR